MSSRHDYMCESPNCPGDARRRQRIVGRLTHMEYLRRTARGRLLYCEACTATERPRRMIEGRRFHTIPRPWLKWL